MSGRYEHTNPILKVLQWLGLMAAMAILAVVLYSFLPTPQSTTSLKILQALQSVCIFVIPALIVASLWSKQPFKWLHLQERISWKVCGVSILLIVVAIPGINLIAEWNQQLTLPSFMQPLEQMMREMEEKAAQLTEQFLKVDSVLGLGINLAVMAFLPALGEELSFRGVLQGLMTPENSSQNQQRMAIWITAILFSTMHFQFFGFIPRMLLGVLFGYALLWSKSLWLPMLMHFVNNAIATIAYYYVFQKGIDPDSINAIGTNKTLWLGIMSLILTGGLCYVLYKELQKENAGN